TEAEHDEKCLQIALACHDAGIGHELLAAVSETLEERRCAQMRFMEMTANAKDKILPGGTVTTTKYEDGEDGLDTGSSDPQQVDPMFEPIKVWELHCKHGVDDLAQLARDGIPLRSRKPYRSFWYLFSTEHYELWKQAQTAQPWDPPALLIHRVKDDSQR